MFWREIGNVDAIGIRKELINSVIRYTPEYGVVDVSLYQDKKYLAGSL
jgi:hypothetical protein